MNIVSFLSGVSLLVARAGAGGLEVPLMAQTQGLKARLSLNTSCPVLLHNSFDLLWVSESEGRSTCPIKSETGYVEQTSSGLASNLRECITTADSSAVYCVYTFSSFAQGRGLSIVASPSIAPLILDASSALGLLDEPNNRGHFYEKILPGRGKGLISNHTFQKGDLILTSTPLFMVQERAISEMNKADRLLLQQLSISTLPSRSSELFYSLAGHFGGDRIEDVLLTNGFSAKFGDSREGFGIVVPEAARLNHDCRPNARFAFDPRTLVHKVHATRTIKPGEELTFSYIDEKQIYSARQQQIEAHWGFHCGCKLCSASDSARNGSDTRLRRIAVLRKYLFLFTAESFRTTNPDMALELVSLYEKEGLDGALAEAYMVTALWYCVWGKIRETREWAALAIENWLVVGGLAPTILWKEA